MLVDKFGNEVAVPGKFANEQERARILAPLIEKCLPAAPSGPLFKLEARVKAPQFAEAN